MFAVERGDVALPVRLHADGCAALADFDRASGVGLRVSATESDGNRLEDRCLADTVVAEQQIPVLAEVEFQFVERPDA
jgi:hypothetical protein